MIILKNSTAGNKLLKGTVVYMAGSVLSKILQLAILPLITAVLLKEEYGYYDLIVTTISLVMPIITLQIIEALFRFMFSANDEEKRRILSTTFLFLIAGIIVLSLLILIISIFTDIIKYPILIVLYYGTYILLVFYQKVCRSMQRNSLFAISGVLNTFVLLSIEAITLLIFDFAVDGLLLAQIISNLICILYLELKIKLFKTISFYYVKTDTIKSMLHFSLPLIPNSISWWFVNSVNKYIIALFLDVGVNGIFSIASKFPQLLTFITSVFQMAWQESAIMEQSSENRDKFYSIVFNNYMNLLFSGLIIVLPVIKLIFPLLVAESYRGGIIYIPILLLGSVFSSFSQFYGTGYLVFGKTSGAFSTTILAAITNISVSIILIPHFGLFGPAIGTMLAYLIQWIYRIFQMKEYFKVEINKKSLILHIFLSLIYIVGYYIFDSIISQIIMIIVALIIFMYTNFNLILSLMHKFININSKN